MRSRLYWVCQLAGWGLYVLVTFVDLSVAGLSNSRSIVEPIIAAAVGIALTHRFRAFVRPRDWLARSTGARLLRMGGAAAVLAAIFVAIVGALEVVGYRDPFSPAVFVFAWLRWTITFFLWMAIYFGYASEVQRQRLAEALQAAQLRALQSQLNPHFLFNALNAVRALIADDPARAQDAVTRLAQALRYTLAAGDDDRVTLARELAMVDAYLDLEGLRLGERLRVERDIDAAAAGAAQLPVMLLQTLVENAVKHGIAQLPEGGTLRLAAHRRGDALELEVENPRPAAPRDADRPGIGLANALERLRLLFGADAALSLDLSQAGRATARVRIPQARPA